MKKLLCTTGLQIGLLFTSAAADYDAAKDFDFNQNPNGVWSYGSMSAVGSPLVLFSSRRTEGSQDEIETLWNSEASLSFRRATNDFMGPDWGDLFPGQTLLLVPTGSAGMGSSAVLRITAPTGGGGDYYLTCAVETRRFLAGGRIRSEETEFQVIKNGDKIFHRFVPGIDAVTYSAPVTLAAGQTLDFVAGPGRNGSTWPGLFIHVGLKSLPPGSSGPSIVAQPRSLGAPVTLPWGFGVTVEGTAPLRHYWYHLSNAHLYKFFGIDWLRNPAGGSFGPSGGYMTPEYAGAWWLVVVNDFGAVATEPIFLTALDPPRIMVQPVGQTVREREALTLSVETVGLEPMQYEWRRDGQAVPGGTSATLSLVNVQPQQTGRYTVLISNQDGSLESVAAMLTVVPADGPPAIVAQPQRQYVPVNGEASFSVSALSLTPMRFQWQLNGSAIAHATNSNLLIEQVQPNHAGSYSVVVSNPYGAITSAFAMLNVYGLTGRQVDFFNIPPALVYDVDDVTPVSVAGRYLVQLHAGPGVNDLCAVGAAVPFMVLPGRFLGGTRYVTNVTVDLPLQLQVRVWDSVYGASYETALAAGAKTGVSKIFQVPSGSVLSPPASLSGLERFALRESVANDESRPLLGVSRRSGSPGTQWVLIGQVNRIYRIESSGDLNVWSEVRTIRVAAGTTVLGDLEEEASPQPCRFYRVRELTEGD